MSTEPKPHKKQQQGSHYGRLLMPGSVSDSQYYWELSRQYAEDGKWQKVLEVLTYLQEQQPLNEGQLFQLAQASYHLGQLTNAEDHLQHLLELDHKSAQAYCLLGIIAKEKFQFKIAENYIRQAIELDSKYITGWIELAKLFHITGYHEESQKACQGALMMTPIHPVPHQILGEIENSQNHTEKAEQFFRQAVDLLEVFQELNKTDHSNVFNALGDFLYSQNNLEEAMTYYAFSLNVENDQPAILQRMGALHAGFGQFKEALNHYSQVMEIDPKNARNFYELGQLYYHLGDLESSNEAFSEAAELAPQMTDAYYELGANYYERESYTEAKTCFKKAIKLEPDYDLPYYSLGLVCLAENSKSKAQQCHQQLIAMGSVWANSLLKHIEAA